jgi:hypothetical protein
VFLAALAIGGLSGGCRGGKAPKARDAAGERAAPAIDAGPYGWPELAELPVVEPVARIELRAAGDGPPLAATVGPVVVGDLAIVGTSRIGFVAVDWRAHELAWQRTAGPHVAPPVAHGDGVLLVADCERAPLPPTGSIIVGCWRVVSEIGADQGTGTLHGPADAVQDFVGARGAVDLVRIDEHRLIWRRGEHAVEIDIDAGTAVPAPVAPVPVIARHGKREWRIAIEDESGVLVARDPRGVEQWRTRTTFDAVIGVLPGLSHEVPMVRAAKLDGVSGRGMVDLLDVEVTGSRQGQAGALVPGIQILGHAFRPPGDTALAVRLDASVRHDFIAAHDRHGRLAWVATLPELPRVDPVGLAITEDAVLAFHDGRLLTVLPPAAVSRNPTP